MELARASRQLGFAGARVVFEQDARRPPWLWRIGGWVLPCRPRPGRRCLRAWRTSSWNSVMSLLGAVIMDVSTTGWDCLTAVQAGWAGRVGLAGRAAARALRLPDWRPVGEGSAASADGTAAGSALPGRIVAATPVGWCRALGSVPSDPHRLAAAPADSAWNAGCCWPGLGNAWIMADGTQLVASSKSLLTGCSCLLCCSCGWFVVFAIAVGSSVSPSGVVGQAADPRLGCAVDGGQGDGGCHRPVIPRGRFAFRGRVRIRWFRRF